MDASDLPRVVPLAEPGEAWSTSASEARVLPEGAVARGAEDAWLVLEGPRAHDLSAPPQPGGRSPGPALAYLVRSNAPRGEPGYPPLRADPARVGGNAFAPLFENARAAGALVSVAASRRVDAGPESERAFVVLAGTGLVFLQNGDALPLEPRTAAIVPAGEPARVWSRGPGDLVVLSLQPQSAPAERRTLAGELRKQREARGRGGEA